MFETLASLDPAAVDHTIAIASDQRADLWKLDDTRWEVDWNAWDDDGHPYDYLDRRVMAALADAWIRTAVVVRLLDSIAEKLDATALSRSLGLMSESVACMQSVHAQGTSLAQAWRGDPTAPGRPVGLPTSRRSIAVCSRRR